MHRPPATGNPSVYRTHPLQLLGPGSKALALVLFVSVWVWIGVPAAGVLLREVIFIMRLLLGLVSFLWLYYVLLDWANELNVVTDDEVLAIVDRPLRFEFIKRGKYSEFRWVGVLKDNLLQRIFDYGDVIILGTGFQKIEFADVSHPKRIYADIQRRYETATGGGEIARVFGERMLAEAQAELKELLGEGGK